MKAENVQMDIRHEREPLLEEEFALLYETTMESSEIIEGFDGGTRAMIYLLADTSGLRKSEIASLTCDSFELANGEPAVTVQAAYSKRRRRVTVVLPKELVPLLNFNVAATNEPSFHAWANARQIR